MIHKVEDPREGPLSGSLVGLDLGGSGSRLAVRPLAGGLRRVLDGPRIEVRAGGSTAPQVIREMLSRAMTSWPEETSRLSGVGIGASGLASLVQDPQELAVQLRAELGTQTAIAIDAVTAHLGALGEAGGAVVALGTGAIAISHPGMAEAVGDEHAWRRVDGWGHLLGDRGGGAWLGRCGLEAAMRAHDGLETHGHALLTAGRHWFGEPESWPAQLYTRDDRAGVLAEFAAEVVAVAARGDETARALVRAAGREAAKSGLAALGEDRPAQLVLTGGLVGAGPLLSDAFAEEVANQRADVSIGEALGDPLEGSLSLARLHGRGVLSPQEGFIWS
ncbi:N-acetylglucosamine kinase [Nesterenkonia sp. Act20]|uniref:N-acetylglucosamine kinase n=1 Tax=Nesterenkonia sp. Act20 TaxID=1483432 RepID=UPI001C459779|nr:BadF/BadG/BcrA/BcrD ATPase family protein [Nesterenkonia sp. Act20]